MSTTEQQNVWFGVSMFLIGLIAGVVLTVASGNTSFRSGSGDQKDGVPVAPIAPQLTIQERIIAFASDIGINEDLMGSCLSTNKFDELINAQQADGSRQGINGTPGNILVNIKTGKARLISGAQAIETFSRNIDELLANPNAASTDPSAPDITGVTLPDLAKDHVRGNKEATLALIEYSDYQCPFCQRVHPTYKALLEKYDGKIMWVLRNYPLPATMHPNAHILAVGAECVNEIGGEDAFWKYTDTVMTSDNLN